MWLLKVRFNWHPFLCLQTQFFTTHTRTVNAHGRACLATAAGWCVITRGRGRCWQITPTAFPNGVIYLSRDHHRTNRRKRGRGKKESVCCSVSYGGRRRWDIKDMRGSHAWAHMAEIGGGLQGGSESCNLNRRPAFRQALVLLAADL